MVWEKKIYPYVQYSMTFRFCYVVFYSHMFNATEVQLWKWCTHTIFLLFMWRSRTPDGVRCLHFPSVITTIMDHKVQSSKPLNSSRSRVDFSSRDQLTQTFFLQFSALFHEIQQISSTIIMSLFPTLTHPILHNRDEVEKTLIWYTENYQSHCLIIHC
jgi:hypothetical protein